jgi:hypothetical protein
MDTDINLAKHYRRRANELRVTARTMHDDEVRHSVRAIAVSYERIARTLDSIVESERRRSEAARASAH